MRRWLNTRGYGVQSPFAFNFLHDVIRQKIPYYAYGELRKSRRPDEINTVQEDEMLFRIANFAQTKSIIMPAEWKGSSRYLSAGCTTAKIEFYTNDNVAQTNYCLAKQANKRYALSKISFWLLRYGTSYFKTTKSAYYLISVTGESCLSTRN